MKGEVFQGYFSCPAYLHWSKGGGALIMDPQGHGVEGTCALAKGPPDARHPRGTAGCRACWLRHDLPVAYEEH